MAEYTALHMLHKFLLMAALCYPALSQSPSLVFEAADVKINNSGEARMAVDFQPGGRFSARNVPMRILIALAYHVRPDMVSGGPTWVSSARYDIVAKGAQTASSAELRRMMQSLLAERFKLVVHDEPKLMTAYALMLGNRGPKMQKSESALTTEQRCVPDSGVEGQKHFVCRHMSMGVLADTLQEIALRDIDVPVVDQTGLTGNFDFQLDWSPAVENPGPGPTLFEAIENQLGLKMQRTRAPLPAIVIDSVERVPIEN